MKYVRVRMTKTTLYFTEPELVRLLAKDPELWREAIRRGKFIQRVKSKTRKEKECRPPF